MLIRRMKIDLYSRQLRSDVCIFAEVMDGHINVSGAGDLHLLHGLLHHAGDVRGEAGVLE